MLVFFKVEVKLSFAAQKRFLALLGMTTSSGMTGIILNDMNNG